MTMQVNGSSATDNIYGGCSDKTEADAKRQEPVSIFSDKNNNGIVDKKDFDDEATAQLAFEKGLLGRSWDAVKDFIDKLLTTDATENLTQEIRYSEIGTEYLADIDDSGKEVRRTYYNEDRRTVRRIMNMEYGEDGKLAKKILLDAEGDLAANMPPIIRYEYDNGKEVKRTYYEEDGTISKIINMEYDEDGKLVKEIYSDAEGNLTGDKPILRHEYAESYERVMYYNKNDEFVSSFVSYTGETPAYNGKNGGEITKAIYDAYNKLPDNDEHENAFNSVLKRIFGYGVRIDAYRDGSREIILKDGTTLYINTAWDGDGSLTITHPDRTVEKYSPEGELLE